MYQLTKCFDCRVLFLTKRPNPRAWSISGWPFLQSKFDQVPHFASGHFSIELTSYNTLIRQRQIPCSWAYLTKRWIKRIAVWVSLRGQSGWNWPCLQPILDQLPKNAVRHFFHRNDSQYHINLSKNFEMQTNTPILRCWRMRPKETNNLRTHKFAEFLKRRH